MRYTENYMNKKVCFDFFGEKKKNLKIDHAQLIKLPKNKQKNCQKILLYSAIRILI